MKKRLFLMTCFAICICWGSSAHATTMVSANAYTDLNSLELVTTNGLVLNIYKEIYELAGDVTGDFNDLYVSATSAPAVGAGYQSAHSSADYTAYFEVVAGDEVAGSVQVSVETYHSVEWTITSTEAGDIGGYHLTNYLVFVNETQGTSNAGIPDFEWYNNIDRPDQEGYHHLTWDNTLAMPLSLAFDVGDIGHLIITTSASVGAMSAVPAPEPATMLLIGTGLAGLVGTGMRKRRRK